MRRLRLSGLRALSGLLCLAWLLAACHAPPSPTPRPEGLPRTEIAALETSLPTARGGAGNPTLTQSPDGSLPTQVLVLNGDASTQTVQSVGPTAAPDPLRFVYPTPAPIPISSWRPALYPVPWAPTPYDHFYFTRPIAADERNWPVADYRYGGKFFADQVHTGVDIPAPIGTPVLAAGPGKVVWAGYGVYRGVSDSSDPYGLVVVIRHDFGYKGELLYTIYGHLSEIDVLDSQHVEAGEPIGKVGQTGKVTGPHLHFEVRLGYNSYFATRNPELWMAPPQGWGVIAGRVMDSSRRLQAAQLVVIQNLETDQTWVVRSYGNDVVNLDAYYQENVVIGDIPAGPYELRTAYAGIPYSTVIQVEAGRVNYFVFRGRDGFSVESPPLPGADFVPPPWEP